PGDAAATAASGSEVITRALPVGADGQVGDGASAELVELAARFDALAVGPGLGRGDAVADLVRGLLDSVAAPVVLDADGLNALGGKLAPLCHRRDAGRDTVLTPH